MNRLLLYILLLSGSYNVFGQQMLKCIPPKKPNADILVWTPKQTNLPIMKKAIFYNGQGYGLIRKETGKNFYAEFELSAKKSGNYRVFAALSQPARSYTSRITFLYNGKVQKINRLNHGIPKWGIHKLMSWIPLGKFKFSSKEKNSFRFQVNEPRSTDGYYVFFCNGIVAFDLDKKVALNLNNWTISTNSPKKGKNLRLKFTCKSDNLTFLNIKVQWKKYEVLSKQITLKPGSSTIDFPIFVAEDWPDGKYKIEVIPFKNQTIQGKKSILFQLGREIIKKSNDNLEVSCKGDEWTISLQNKLSLPGTLGVWGFDEQKHLMAVAEFQIPANVLTIKVQCPNCERWQSFNEGTLKFFIDNSVTKPIVKEYKTAKTTIAKKFKPMSHGIYTQQDGTNHYWSINDQHAMVWDGKTWIPVGGMFVPDLLRWPTFNAAERDKQWKNDRKSLDALAKFRKFDMYINGNNGGSPWLRQMVVDEFNRRGIKFGCQINPGARPVSGYNIYSSVSQGLLTAECREPGVLELSLSRKEKIESFLLIPAGDNGEIKNITLQLNASMRDTEMYLIQNHEAVGVKKKGDFQTVRKKVAGLEVGRYYVMPKIVMNKKRISDVWGQLDKIKSQLAWVKDTNWGDGLRFFVDPICGEGGNNNHYEVFRIWSKPFNQSFAVWLKNKYGTVSALSKVWALPADSVKSFAVAANLVPMRNLEDKSFSNSILLIDPLTGASYRTVNSPGESWLDYLTAVRYTYSLKRDKIAAYLKKMVNVPVILKRVAPWYNIEGVNRTANGFDGLGLELYPNDASAGGIGLTSARAEVDNSFKTLWFIGTELGYSSKSGNRGVRGWPNKQALRQIIRSTAGAGSKGFFIFALKVPKTLWYHHNMNEMPDRLQWFVDVIDELYKDWPKTVNYAINYPGGHSWWWCSNGMYHNRYNCMYRSVPTVFPTSILLRKDGEKELWTASSPVPVDNVDLVVTNLKSDFYAGAYEEQLKKYLDTKKMLYLGFWPRTKHLPQLGKHFTDKMAKLTDGSVVQSLKVFAGDKILASSGNDVWAKISDNVMIISRNPVARLKKNKFQIPDFVKTEWLDKFNVQISVIK